MVKRAESPPDEDDGVSELQEKVLELLEGAGIATETNDKIVALIHAAETGQPEPDLRETFRAYIKAQDRRAWLNHEYLQARGKANKSAAFDRYYEAGKCVHSLDETLRNALGLGGCLEEGASAI